uniref:Uncharacterized protein n=1 Tax=Ciona savignyi TaxID=51511 RepID=H2ZJE8_CIOSA
MAKKLKRRAKYKTKKRTKLKKNKIKKLQKKLSELAEQRKSEELSAASETNKNSSNQSPEKSSQEQTTGSSIKKWETSTTTLSESNLEAEKIVKHELATLNTHRRRALAILHNRLGGLEIRFQRDVYELERIYTKKYYKPLLDCRGILLNSKTSEDDASLLQPSVNLKQIDSCFSAFESNKADFKKLKLHLQAIADTNLCSDFWEDFWLITLLNSDYLLRSLIHTSDIPKLRYLTDISCEQIEASQEEFKKENVVGFELRFQFRPNPYFTNHEIWKRYLIDLNPDDEDYIITPDDPSSQEQNNSTTIKYDCDADIEDSEHEDSSTVGSIRSKKLKKFECLLDYKGPQVVAISSSKI